MNRVTLIAAGLALAMGAAAPGQAQTAAADDPVVAVVNGEKLYQSQVGLLFNSLPDQYKQIPMDVLFPQLVEGLIDRRILAQAARDAGFAAAADVQRRIDYFTDDILQDAYLSDRLDDELTEAHLRETYERTVASAPAQDEVRARHILVETEEEAVTVIAELESGADFAALAEERSTGPSSANGGDLGYFTVDQMVPEFAEAAFSLAPGETTSEPVQTQFGWHVIRVEDRRVTGPPSYEEIEDALRNQEAQRIIGGIMDDLRAEATVERVTGDDETTGESDSQN